MAASRGSSTTLGAKAVGELGLGGLMEDAGGGSWGPARGYGLGPTSRYFPADGGDISLPEKLACRWCSEHQSKGEQNPPLTRPTGRLWLHDDFLQPSPLHPILSGRQVSEEPVPILKVVEQDMVVVWLDQVADEE